MRVVRWKRQGRVLHGIEYIISATLYDQLPPAEKMYWHPHNYEVLSGELVMPGLPEAAEKQALKDKINSYGKTWHVWNTGAPGQAGDRLPLGPAMLAWSFNPLIRCTWLGRRQPAAVKDAGRADFDVPEWIPCLEARSVDRSWNPITTATR